MAEAGIGFEAAATPESMRLYAVGDIHGRYDLMTEMHGRIMDEIMRDRLQDWRIVYLGDYVDRGPASRQVLEFLSRASLQDPRILTLAGNHDLAFLSFLSQPTPEGLFARSGGDATAQSYGVELRFHPREALLRGHAALSEAVPDTHRAFLKGLKLSVSFGDLFFCHAGIRPGIPLGEQSADDLVWIRELFRHHPGLHPKLIVHGHTPQRAAEIMPNRVNLDTGAFQSGRLTGMMFEGRKKRLMEVGG